MPDFQQLLRLVKEDRLRTSSMGSRGILVASESDKGRVINHSAFRRLLGKAQVFPLDTNAAVRTRLTHSIEVSQVGRHIAQVILSNFPDQQYETSAAFVNTVETACLLHDIGNPPFGHFGESALQGTFADLQETFSALDAPAGLKDFIRFDGNPQGFRLITFSGGKDDYGLNLTCTLLLSTIKYPWTASQVSEDSNKFGVFTSDRNTYENICERLQWPPGKKFPLLLIMEAADDIAYCMSDLEDGLEKRLISFSQLQGELSGSLGEDLFQDSDDIDNFISFKTRVIRNAVEFVADAFVNNIEAILEGEVDTLISKGSSVDGNLKTIKSFARKNIYATEDAERIELAGRSVITGLMKHFEELLSLSEEEFLSLVRRDNMCIRRKRLDYHARLFRMFPRGYIDKYKRGDRGEEFIRRAHLVVDYISGMTDEYALEVYQVLEGIRIR